MTTTSIGSALIIGVHTAVGLGAIGFIVKEYLAWSKDQDKPWASPLNVLLFLEQRQKEVSR